MKRMTTFSAAAALMSSTAIAGSHVDTGTLSDAIRQELGSQYDLSQFDEIKVRIRRNEIRIEAEGNNLEVERTYTIADGGLGALVEAEEEFVRDGVEITREFDDGRWVEEIDDEDDEEDDDEEDDDEEDDDEEDGEEEDAEDE